ncbi:hypothetical protein [Limnobaculum parvum]|uniref:HTH rpiR-type domain-containing protein n=1 Tax=Limnobaculum parvum TaxID=2172103 RepID=A0A2Y9U140_9GAMM|nr:hypothetical protein [Limnobaculum parvum]AWH89687.1 hypothetical protein HYN51_14730 [Limnobaculum parvum]
MACLAVMATNLAQFPPMEKNIPEYIQENAKRIRELSSQELAAILNISQSQVVKLVLSW